MTALRVLICSYLVHNYTCGFAEGNLIWLFCLSLSMKKDKYEMTCMRVLIIGFSWTLLGTYFLNLSIAAFGPYLTKFSATMLLWCIFNASLHKWLALFWTVFCFCVEFLFFFFNLPVLSYTIKSAHIQTWVPWAYEPVLDAHVPVPQAVSCITVYMKSVGKGIHQNTVHQSGKA